MTGTEGMELLEQEPARPLGPLYDLLAKLGAPNRNAAAVQAARLGLAPSVAWR